MSKSNKPAEEVSAMESTSEPLNAHVQTTFCTQYGNKILGTEDKQLYYLIIQTTKGKCVINIGQKTHDTIIKMTL